LPEMYSNICGKPYKKHLATSALCADCVRRYLDDGKSYDSTGAKEVWCSNASSGLDKRQCTVQLTIFADGVSRVRPTIIFRGQGKRISPNEKRSWDSRVNVMFQLKAWCDENVMKVWIEREWGNMFPQELIHLVRF